MTSSVKSTTRTSKQAAIIFVFSRVAYLQYQLVTRSQRRLRKLLKRCLNQDTFFIVPLKVLGWFLLSSIATSAVWANECDLSASSLSTTQKVKIEKVIDGDTVRIEGGKLVRFIGINTPEIDHQYGRSQPFAEKARQHLKAIISKHNGQVLLQMDSESQDRHGRKLSHIFTTSGKNIQADLLHRGLGVWIVVPPNLAYMDCYRNNEKLAREQKTGVWSEQFRLPRDTNSLTHKETGFQWIQGKIDRIGKGKKYLWLNFEDALQDERESKHSKVTLRIHKDDLHYFKEQALNGLLNKVVRVKGWLTKYKKQLVMTLRHPASLEIVNH